MKMTSRKRKTLAGIVTDIDSNELDDVMFKLMTSKSAYRVYIAWVKMRVATVKEIQEITGLPEATMYRAVKRLRKMELLIFAGSRRTPNRKGGPDAALWRVER